MVTKPVKGTGRRRITNAHQKAAEAKAVEEAKPYRRGALAAVEEHILKNPGAHLWASDIMAATGLDKRAVQAAVGDLIRRGGYADRITVLRPGNAWRLKEANPVVERRGVGGGVSRVNVATSEPAWDPEQGPNPGGAWDPEAAPPDMRVGPATVPAVVHTALPGGALIIGINGQQYHAKPLS